MGKVILFRRERSGLFARCVCLMMNGLLASVFFAQGAYPFTKKGPVGHLDAGIENISYSGSDEYRLQVSLTNASSRGIPVKVFEREFFVQTDSGWRRVTETGAGREGNLHPFLPAGGKRTSVVVVKIALDEEGLFRTYEGDISFMFRYRVGLADSGGARQGERLYWITPKTGRWLEREGM